MADFVLNASYGMLLERVNRLKQGDQSVQIEEIHFDKLCEGLRLLADRFEAEENIQDALEAIITIAFSPQDQVTTFERKEILCYNNVRFHYPLLTLPLPFQTP